MDNERQQKFVLQLTQHQNRVYSYIFSMLCDHNQAADVLQETNLVLWRRSEEWSPGTPFLPWAFTVARFQILAYFRDRKRQRCLLDTELVEALSDDVAAASTQLEESRDALRKCLKRLSEQNREVIQLRYCRGKSVADLAELLKRSAVATKVLLLRIRRSLHDCVSEQLARPDGARR